MKKNVKYIEITSPVLEVLGVMSASVILRYGGFQVLTDKVSQGTFIAFIVGLFMMYAPLRLLFKIYTNVQSSLAGAERVFSILDLDEEKIKELSEYANRKEEISVDLNEEKIVYGNSEIKFQIDPFKKKCLLEGLDDIALSLKKSDKIENFEKNIKNIKPWIFND